MISFYNNSINHLETSPRDVIAHEEAEPSSRHPPSPTTIPNTSCAPDTECLVLTLNAGTTGGHVLFAENEIKRRLAHKLTFDVWDDLRAFTGMSESELMERLTRQGRYHFQVEHDFFSPQSSSELAMYYRSSSAYVWANAIHPAIDMSKLNITREDGPVLEYSGGVGSNVLALASHGVKVVYFGIGLMELEFAHFRAQRHGLAHVIDFVRPYQKSSETGWHFDPFRSLELGASIKEPLGAIFALDVFEHIPDYHITARHLISLLRDGGKLFENSPFSGRAKSENDIQRNYAAGRRIHSNAIRKKSPRYKTCNEGVGKEKWDVGKLCLQQRQPHSTFICPCLQCVNPIFNYAMICIC